MSSCSILLVSHKMLDACITTQIHNYLARDESVAFAFDKKFSASDHAPVVAEFCEELIAPV